MWHGSFDLESCQCPADEAPWDELAELFDDTWYIKCDVDTAMDRIFDRQVAVLNPHGMWITTRPLD